MVAGADAVENSGAWLAAAVFALHPVNVESVAWITERKNTLAMFFYALTLSGICGIEDSEFGRRSERARRHWYWFRLALVLALLSKTAVVMLPWCCWGWRGGGGDGWSAGMWGAAFRSLPWRWCGSGHHLVSISSGHRGRCGADGSFGARLAGAGWAVWFYLYKAVLPLNLAFVYPRWQIDRPARCLTRRGYCCWPAVGLLDEARGGGGAFMFGLGYFLLLLLPVLGFINIYFMRYSLVADHWQYFWIMGVIVLALAGLDRLFDRLWRQNAIVRPIFSAALLIGLGVLTWRQCGIYHDMETLWKDTLKKNTRLLARSEQSGRGIGGAGTSGRGNGVSPKITAGQSGQPGNPRQSRCGSSPGEQAGRSADKLRNQPAPATGSGGSFDRSGQNPGPARPS